MGKKAVIIERFQPYHRGHHLMIKNLLNEYEQVVVAVGSSGAPLSCENPFTERERIEMIKASLNRSELSKITFLPVEDEKDFENQGGNAIKTLKDFDVLYSGNPRIIALFRKFGLKVSRIKHYNREKFRGKNIRDIMKRGLKMWQTLLPAATTRYLLALDAEKRIKKLEKKKKS